MSNNAIEMTEDLEGFTYPYIIKERCTNCGACDNICIYKKESIKITEENFPLLYAAYNKDKNIRLTSTSGGIFTSLYKHIIDKGGAVIGVKYDDNMQPTYDIAYSINECEAFRGSKYVAANKNDILQKAKKILDKGTIVLFSGTPCEIAALKSLLAKDYDNLYCVEIICHGTPSPKIFRQYVNYLEDKMDAKMINFSFRENNADGMMLMLKQNLKRVKSITRERNIIILIELF
jgi:coenzyme F420-reducing hydrogenase beta subunit